MSNKQRHRSVFAQTAHSDKGGNLSADHCPGRATARPSSRRNRRRPRRRTCRVSCPYRCTAAEEAGADRAPRSAGSGRTGRVYAVLPPDNGQEKRPPRIHRPSFLHGAAPRHATSVFCAPARPRFEVFRLPALRACLRRKCCAQNAAHGSERHHARARSAARSAPAQQRKCAQRRGARFAAAAPQRREALPLQRAAGRCQISPFRPSIVIRPRADFACSVQRKSLPQHKKRPPYVRRHIETELAERWTAPHPQVTSCSIARRPQPSMRWRCSGRRLPKRRKRRHRQDGAKEAAQNASAAYAGREVCWAQDTSLCCRQGGQARRRCDAHGASRARQTGGGNVFRARVRRAPFLRRLPVTILQSTTKSFC